MYEYYIWRGKRKEAFCANTGRAVYWSRADIRQKQDYLLRIQASSTMPVFMPPVEIDGLTYVDGALGTSGGIPLDAAKQAGFKKFLVISTRERDYVKSPFKANQVTNKIFKDFPAVTEALSARPENYNATREELFDLESQGDAYLYTPTGFLVSNQERNLSKLRRSFVDSSSQIERELPAIRDFLEL